MYGTTQIDVMAPTVDVRASGTARPSKWLVDWVRGDESDSGISLTTDKALSYAPVLQAVSVLAGDVGQLPVELHKRIDERNKERDRKHRAWRLTRRRANPYMSAMTFRETMMLYVLFHGNGVAEIEWDQARRPKYLWPLLPHRTTREIDDAGNLWYITKVGQEPATVERRLRPENVIHISNFGPDGTWGYPTITLARNSWGLGLAGEKYANVYFKNNGMPSGTLEVPQTLDDEGYNRLRRDWRKTHEGLSNAARIAILEQGAKYNPISFNHKDSQWLESRQFQRTDVASWFNLPPHKVGDLEHATFTNIEEQNRSYLDTSLMRWLVKWQDEFDEKLLTKKEKETDSHFFEFNVAALLRGDIEKRYKAYAVALGGHPFAEINEVRGKENMNAVEGGDEIPEPLNMSTGQAAQGEPADKASDDPVEAKISELLRCEANRIAHAAKTAKNFVAWVDAFYTQWGPAIASVIGVEDSDSRVIEWVTAAKTACLESAGRATNKEQLHGMIAATVAAWPLRAAEYAALFTKGTEK